jgi:hypothetical protein
MKTRDRAKAFNLSAARRCLCAAASLLLLSRAPASDCAAQGVKRARVAAIQAKLFYNSTGTFSENALNGGVDLWNSPFDSSYSTLVLVELDGLPEYLDPLIRVELVARYVPFDRVRGGVRVRQVEVIRNGSEDGKAYAAFWLKRTGCNPVHLAARIVGQRRRVEETIEFGCGE